MVEAFDAGRLRFAALDVFRDEPLISDSSLWQRRDVLVSPHMSGDSVGWRERIDRLHVSGIALGPVRTARTPHRGAEWS